MPDPKFFAESKETVEAEETVDLTDVMNIQYEVQELCGLEKSILSVKTMGQDFEVPGVVDSYASTPAFRVNVPEIRESKASFVYNFFTPNEREIIDDGGNILDVSVSRDDEIFFQLSNDRKPRFVKLEFKPPRRYSSIKELRNSRFVSRNIDKIIVEGGVTNEDFVSFEIVDSGKEKHLYDMLRGSMFFTQTEVDEDSPQSALNKFLDAQDDGSVTGQEKKFISSALQSMQSRGYKVARTDVSPEDAENAEDLLARQNFTLQVNKLAMDELVQSAIRIPDSVFQDEFLLAKDFAQAASASAKRRNSSSSNTENVYTTKIKPIKSIPLASKFGPTVNPENLFKAYSDYPIIKHAGYLIKKLEVLGDDRYAERGFITSDNPDGLFIIDENVRYGGVYVYEIRSIYQVQMIAEERDEDDPSLDDVCIVTALVASEGKMTSVRCVENTPPDPPANVRVSFDYQTRKPRINWQFPVNPQRDVKRFQIFKRLSVSLPFTLIAEYDFDNSTIRTDVAESALEDRLFRFPFPKISFIDNEWQDGEEPIYTVACVDAHGFSSNYGTQMMFKYDRAKNKSITKMISFPNAPKPYPNLLLNNDSFDDAIKVSGYERMRVYFDPEYYKVTRNASSALPGSQLSPTEKDLDFLRINTDKDTYKIHIINVDLQKDKTLNIRIGDFSGAPDEVIGTNSFSPAGLNF